MSGSEKLSYLVPRNPSINCWNDRVKLNFPLTENVVKLGLDACEESVNEKLKVYLRIKPCEVDFNPYSIINNTLEAKVPNNNGACKNLSKNVGSLINKFHFTKIFSPESTQETVFEKCVLSNLRRFMDGRNDLLFAYGTTNSGKTFTMQGTLENPGIIPRAIQFIFKCLDENVDDMPRHLPFRYNEICLLDDEDIRKNILHKNFILNLNLVKYQRNPELSWRSYKTGVTISINDYSDSYENETFREMEKNIENLKYEIEDDSYTVWISMIEIYNEQIYDLLEIPNEREIRVKLGFAEDESGKVYIKNLRYIPVKNGHEAFQVFEFGRANLRLGPTALNYWSSRSHCICTLTLGRFSKKENSYIALSRFSFCDLAGAERVKKALAEGNRLVESKSINTSLSIFAKCLSVIRENQSNAEKKIVPYRESKLTRLFRDAMMGKEAFSIIVNVTPECHLFNETLNVLKFSAVARQIVPMIIVPKQIRMKEFDRSKIRNGFKNMNRNCNTDWAADDVILKEDEKNIEFDDLLKLVDDLKKEVVEERERANNIERKIREEFETKFSEVIDHIEKQRNLFECENKRIRGVCDREKERLMKHYEERERRLKRKRPEEDCSNYIEMGTQIEILTKDLQFLKSENASLKDLIQQMNAKSNFLQKKCSKMQFELSEKDRILNAYKQNVKDSGSDKVVKELEKQLLQSKTRNEELKELLNESHFDYKDLLVTNSLIKEENHMLLTDLAATCAVVDDLKKELRDYKEILTINTNKMEEPDYRLDQSNSCIYIESQVQNHKMYEVVDLEEIDEKNGNVREEGGKERPAIRKSSDDSELMKSLKDSRNETPDDKAKNLTGKIIFKKEIEDAFIENRLPEGEVKLTRPDLMQDQASLIYDKDLVCFVDQMKQKIAEEREKADDIECKLRKELETRYEELIELHILKERDMYQNEKRRMSDEFDRKKRLMTECFAERMKNLTRKCNQQSETIALLNEELQQLTARIADMDCKRDEMTNKALVEKNIALMEQNKKQVNLLKKENYENKKGVTCNVDLVESPGSVRGDGKVSLEELIKKWGDGERCETKEYEIFRKNRGGEKENVAESGQEFLTLCDSEREDDLMENSSPRRLSREIDKLSILRSEPNKSYKKNVVSNIDKNIHPSLVKLRQKSKEKGKKQKETESKEDEFNDHKKEESSVKNNKGKKCKKKLFVDNDFDDIDDLEASFMEPEIPRLRPRRK